jgi:hypothetical protein
MSELSIFRFTGALGIQANSGVREPEQEESK